MHIGKGTILVIGGLKYLESHEKPLKYVKKQGIVGKSRGGEKMQNRELSRGNKWIITSIHVFVTGKIMHYPYSR